MGGSVRHIIVGGDYCPQKVLDFIRICCSWKIWEAYTSNQAAGIISLSSHDDIVKDHLGGVLEHLKIKLELIGKQEWPIYKFEEEPPSIGRVFIKGPGVAQRLNEKEQEKIEENNNWIDTSDIAYVSSNGAIKLLSSLDSKIVLKDNNIVNPIYLEGMYGQLEIIKDIRIQTDLGNNFLTAMVFPNKDFNETRPKIPNFDKKPSESIEEKTNPKEGENDDGK